MICSFFFQAEDGIRDLTVTGVQTCALPISHLLPDRELLAGLQAAREAVARLINADTCEIALATNTGHGLNLAACALPRSEERRVGKECRSRWSPDDYTKKERNKVHPGINRR